MWKKLLSPWRGGAAWSASRGELSRRADEFRLHLKRIKAETPLPSGVAWYPYDSLANFEMVDKLLAGEDRSLLNLVGRAPLLDVGCADGDTCFFLETLGYRVQAVDYPPTNHNRMEGIKALKRALSSQVEIHHVDLDSQFTLPERHYGLVLFLGLLYHLKNPFYVLERLARHTRYCVLSTRVAQVTPDKQTSLQALPVAYLVDEVETNGDWTNYWIFSEAGLKRLVARTGWKILAYRTTGHTKDSDPASQTDDERAFCLLESTMTAASLECDLLDGWHELEHGVWRWTERCFGVEFPVSPVLGPARLEFRFVLPEAVFQRLGPLALAAEANGHALEPQKLEAAGEHLYARPVPEEVMSAGPVTVRFWLDRAIAPTDADRRELGLIVPFGDLQDSGKPFTPFRLQ